MKRADVELFEKIATQLAHLHDEVCALAKKSPNDAMNTFKLGFVNSALAKCNDLLGRRYRPFPDFDQFSSDDMPSNSDVTFILSQYLACAETLRAANIFISRGRWYWDIDGIDPEDPTEGIRTSPPTKLSRK